MIERTPEYFKITDDLGIAINLKVGSSSIAYAVIQAHYPAIASGKVFYPDDGKEHNRPGWQGLCPKVDNPATVLLPVRDPVERFRSAMAQLRLTDVNETLDRLESEGVYNAHFQYQHRPAKNTTKLFLFPDHLEQLAAAASLPYPLEQINEAEGAKPTLNRAQVDRVLAFYADDQTLFESISTAGQEMLVPSEPTPEVDAIPELNPLRMVDSLVTLTDVLLAKGVIALDDMPDNAKRDYADAKAVLSVSEVRRAQR